MARTPREVWAKRVERWQSSDLTAKEFAAEIGVNDRTLAHWKWMLGKEATTRSPARRRRGRGAEVKFTEVAVEPTVLIPGAPIEIVVGGGLVIRVDRQFDEDTLRRARRRARERVIPASVRIFVCQVPQDMRRLFDGLTLAASEHSARTPATASSPTSGETGSRCCGSTATGTASSTRGSIGDGSSCRAVRRSMRGRWVSSCAVSNLREELRAES